MHSDRCKNCARSRSRPSSQLSIKIVKSGRRSQTSLTCCLRGAINTFGTVTGYVGRDRMSLGLKGEDNRQPTFSRRSLHAPSVRSRDKEDGYTIRSTYISRELRVQFYGLFGQLDSVRTQTARVVENWRERIRCSNNLLSLGLCGRQVDVYDLENLFDMHRSFAPFEINRLHSVAH
jgi:hypothetical protein